MINARVFDLIAYINNPVVPGAITLLGAVTLDYLIMLLTVILMIMINFASWPMAL